MRSSLKLGALSAAMVAAALLAPTSNASAGVMSIAGKSTVETQSAVDQVHWRRWCYPRHRHVWHYGWHRHHAHFWRHRYVYYNPWRWGYRYSYYPSYRYSYYPRYRYGYYPYGYGYNPGAAVAGAALGLASAPLWGLTGGYPYYW